MAPLLLVQTVRHRDYFPCRPGAAQPERAAPPSRSTALLAGGLLMLALAGGGAAGRPGADHREGRGGGAPQALVGIIIAAVVLMPEGLAARRAARANRLQTSLNLALGSAWPASA